MIPSPFDHARCAGLLAGCLIALFAVSPAWAQSKAHQLAFQYGQLIGKTVWCGVSTADRERLHWRAERLVDTESYNDPERRAAQRKLKDVIAQAARARPAESCTAIEAAVQENLQELDRPR